MAGAGGSLRAGVTENPVRLTRSVRDALTTVTAGGAPVYVWPGGGITFMVDVTLLPKNAFGYVPTPAIVAPIEFTLRLEDYAALGGHIDEVRSLEDVVEAPRRARDQRVRRRRRLVAERVVKARAQFAELADGRRHFHDGPIDLILQAFGAPDQIAERLRRRRAQVLDRARRTLRGIAAAARARLARRSRTAGPRRAAHVARRRAASPDLHFLTPMAAVAGAVAEEILAAMTAAAPLARAYVNNGGDIALHLAPRRDLRDRHGRPPRSPALFGRATISGADAARGIATSGWRGRSFSLGIADAVTVIARDAATADAAATLIANAVDLPGPSCYPRAFPPARSIRNPISATGSSPATSATSAITSRDRAGARRGGSRAFASASASSRRRRFGLHEATRLVGGKPGLYKSRSRTRELELCQKLNCASAPSSSKTSSTRAARSREMPYRRGAILSVIKNPFAGRFVEEIESFSNDLKPLGLEMAKALIEALGGDPTEIEGYGKGAIVGSAGEVEHGALWHAPGGYAMREALGGAMAIVPSAKKVAGAGARLDVPITHKDASYVRSHFDAIEVGLADAPRADEMLLVLAMTTGPRVHDRAGGLKASDIKAKDGLR